MLIFSCILYLYIKNKYSRCLLKVYVGRGRSTLGICRMSMLAEAYRCLLLRPVAQINLGEVPRPSKGGPFDPKSGIWTSLPSSHPSNFWLILWMKVDLLRDWRWNVAPPAPPGWPSFSHPDRFLSFYIELMFINWLSFSFLFFWFWQPELLKMFNLIMFFIKRSGAPPPSFSHSDRFLLFLHKIDVYQLFISLFFSLSLFFWFWQPELLKM